MLSTGKTKIDTTLGDLIAALKEETSTYIKSEDESNQVVAFMVKDIIENYSVPKNLRGISQRSRTRVNIISLA